MDGPEAPNAEWEQKVERRLTRRLADHTDDLEQCSEEISRDGVPGLENRQRLVTAWGEAFRRHCARVLADLVTLMEEAGEGGVLLPWLSGRFAAHAEEVLTRTLHALAEHRDGASPVTAVERRRLANLCASVKAEITNRLEQEAARIDSQGPTASGTAASDADDRLPLHRRAAFDRDLERMVRSAMEIAEPLGLAMMDLDHFKKVNDENGHPVGDEVLLAAAQIVVRCVRGKGKAYRYGGEEIALLLPNHVVDEAAAVAERIRRELGAAPISSRRLAITASFGVAAVPAHATSPKALLEKADAALYQAKHSGRNRVCAST
jgi:diguanylate cyclase (GGDEF)-like protein